MTTETILFAGPSAAGKSNYLFRAWLSISKSREGRLQTNGTPDELDYLWEGVNRQLSGEFAQKTQLDVSEMIVIPLTVDGRELELTVPDRPGEDWSGLYSDRRFPGHWDELIASANGILFFIPSQTPDDPIDRMQTDQFGGTNATMAQGRDMSRSGPPMQIMMTDVIMMCVERRRQLNGRPMKLGIVVTAWDLLHDEDQRIGPHDHLRQEHKLLHDFVSTNRDALDLEVFGVSLFGGDLNDEGFRAEVLAGEPSKMGYTFHHLEGAVERSDDVLLPIKWALDALD